MSDQGLEKEVESRVRPQVRYFTFLSLHSVVSWVARIGSDTAISWGCFIRGEFVDKSQ